MAELACVNCGCPPHKDKPCAYCGKCKVFLRCDVQSARALTNINNMLMDTSQNQTRILIDIMDLLRHAFPEAEKAVNAEREELRAKYEQERANATAVSGEGDGPNYGPAGDGTRDPAPEAEPADGSGSVVAGAFGPPSEDFMSGLK